MRLRLSNRVKFGVVGLLVGVVGLVLLFLAWLAATGFPWWGWGGVVMLASGCVMAALAGLMPRGSERRFGRWLDAADGVVDDVVDVVVEVLKKIP